LEGQKRKKNPTYFSAPKWPELGGKHKLLMNFTVLPQMSLPRKKKKRYKKEKRLYYAIAHLCMCSFGLERVSCRLGFELFYQLLYSVKLTLMIFSFCVATIPL